MLKTSLRLSTFIAIREIRLLRHISIWKQPNVNPIESDWMTHCDIVVYVLDINSRNTAHLQQNIRCWYWMKWKVCLCPAAEQEEVLGSPAAPTLYSESTSASPAWPSCLEIALPAAETPPELVSCSAGTLCM